MKNKIVEFIKDESGQTSTEYILLVAVVAFIVFKFKNVINQKLFESGGVMDKVFGGNQLNDLLK